VPDKRQDGLDTPACHHPIFLAAWHAMNFLLAASLVAALYCMAWEYSTRRYLHGFSDAIMPATASQQEKVEAILNWMEHGPARRLADPSLPTSDRDPVDTLNYHSLLLVCGTATNAFINLADSGGLKARRLLLLDSRHMTKHVVAEVFIGGRWIVVDPAYRAILRGPSGELLTRQDLMSPGVFSTATGAIPGYDPSYTYSIAVHVRLSHLRVLEMPLRRALDRFVPGWEDEPALSLLLERRSLAWMIAAIGLFLFLVLARACLRWYAESRLALHPVHVREQARRAWHVFLSTPN